MYRENNNIGYGNGIANGNGLGGGQLGGVQLGSQLGGVPNSDFQSEVNSFQRGQLTLTTQLQNSYQQNSMKPGHTVMAIQQQPPPQQRSVQSQLVQPIQQRLPNIINNNVDPTLTNNQHITQFSSASASSVNPLVVDSSIVGGGLSVQVGAYIYT
jgi:hypothetical protein